MAFIYEVNGQRVEFEREPTEKDIDEAASQLRLKPQSNMPKPVEGSGGAAFGVYRPAGRRPESQQDREASKEMPLQTARGLVTGTLGAPADLLNLPGQLYGMAAKEPAPYRIPLGSEEFNQMLPFQSDTPQARLARLGGEALAPFPTIKGAKMLAQAPGQLYQTGKEFTQGAMEGLRNPTYQRNAQTAFAPLKETFYPTPEVQKFQNAPVEQRPGMLPGLEASQQPSSSLFNTPTELLAKALGPKTAKGENLIPFQGETTKAFGEVIGRDIANQPFKSAGLPSLAGATIGGFAGGPIGALIGAGAGAAINPIVRAAELYSLNKLGKTAGFARGFPENLSQAQSTAARQMMTPGPVAPQLGYTPNPTIPAATQPRSVNIEGQSYNLPYEINTQQSQTARPQPVAPAPLTPSQISQQAAASKIQNAPAGLSLQQQLSPEAQARIEAIRARSAAGSTPLQPKGPFTQPVAGPVEPTPIQSLPSERWSPEEKLALERAKLQQNPPPPMSAAEQAKAQKEMSKQSNLTDWGKKTEIDKDAARGLLKNWFEDTNKATNPIYGNLIDLDDKVAWKEVGGAKLANQVKAIQQKFGVDSIPSVPGFRDEEVIRMAYDMIDKKSKKPVTYTPSENKSTTSLQEALKKVQQNNKEPRSVKEINNEWNNIDEQMANLREENLGVKPNTPQGEAYSKQMNDLAGKAKDLEKELELAKKAEKKTSKKGPSNVSKMMTSGETSWVPKEYNTSELTKAILTEGGEWKQGDKTIKYQDLGGGDARIQVRKNGMVVEEYYK